MILPFIPDSLFKMIVKKLIPDTECSSQLWFKIWLVGWFDFGVVLGGWGWLIAFYLVFLFPFFWWGFLGVFLFGGLGWGGVLFGVLFVCFVSAARVA